MKPINIKSLDKNQQGFSLLEVMIALLIFSVGLLGLAGMQMGGLQSNHSAMMRTIATLQSYDMAERLRSNRMGNYAAPNAGSVEDIDLTTWNQMVGRELPSGQGQIQVLGGGAFNVSVMWDEDRNGAVGTKCDNTAGQLECIRLSVTP